MSEPESENFFGSRLLVWMLIGGLICSGSLYWALQGQEQWGEEDWEEEEELPPPSTKEVYAFLKEKFPEAYHELILARDEDAVQEFQAALTRAAEFVMEYRDLAEDDEQAAGYFLEIERSRLVAFGLADRYHAAETEDSRREFLGKLQKASEALFELQIKEQEYELKRLREEVQAIGELIQERKANRAVEVREILTEFLEESEWEEDEESEE